MANKGNGISGTALAAGALGSILLWSSIKGKKWTGTIRELIAGNQPTDVNDYPIDTSIADSSTGAPGNNSAGPGAPGTPGGPTGSLAAFIWSIGIQESDGNYNIPDSSAGAIGKYQLLPSNVTEWSKEMGQPMTVSEFRANPALQEKLAQWKLNQLVQKYGYAGAAAVWYSGTPNPNSSVGNPPVWKYVQEVLSRMSQYKGG